MLHKTVIYMMKVNIQHFPDEQKANFDQFIELKTLILSIIPGMRQFERVPQFE